MLNFFSKEEEKAIVKAIQNAEARTSGEIRVHIEDRLKVTVLEEAGHVFRRLDMHKTKAHNGVLILLAPNDKQFAIIGDSGIHAAVETGFWDDERDILQGYFRKAAFCEGVCEVIYQIGEKLKLNFPVEADDVNELPDEISYS